MPLPTEEQLRAALKTVVDPEVGLNIVDLGLIYGIEVAAAGVTVRLTMTSPACPMGDLVLEEARAALEPLLPAPLALDLQLVWEPPWSPALMAPGAKAALGWDA